MSGIKFGYARISTHDQTRDLQIDALLAYGCERRRIFIDICSGAVACADRPQRQRPGDVLAVWNLDRLGRDLQDLLGKENIGFVSLTQEWADTTTPMCTFLFQVFGGLAELERKRISEHTRTRGRMSGRCPRLTAKSLQWATELMRKGDLPVREIASIVGVLSSTLYRHLTPDGTLRREAKA